MQADAETRRGEITRLLQDWAEGNPEAADRLFPRVYDELSAYYTVKRERQRIQIKAIRTRAFEWVYRGFHRRDDRGAA